MGSVNQNLVSSKLSDSEAYNIKNIIIPFPRDYLNMGENKLCIHIKGDPLSKETGLYYGRPYLFDEITENFVYTKDYLLIFLVTVYILIGIFYLIFFIKKSNEKYYLYFSLFSLILAFYIFIRSPELQIQFPWLKSWIIFRIGILLGSLIRCNSEVYSYS